MTAIDAAVPRVQAVPAEPRYKLPTTPPPTDEELNVRWLAERGYTVETWAAKDAEILRMRNEHMARFGLTDNGPVRFAGTADAAAEGQRLVSSLGGLLGAANDMRQTLESSRGDDRFRLLFGEEWAAARLRRMEEGIQAVERGIAGYQAEIGSKFQVQGKLAERDEVGACVLEHQAAGFAVRVGSDGRAWESRGGGFEAVQADPDPGASPAALPARVDLHA